MTDNTLREQFSKRLNSLLDRQGYPEKYAGRQTQLEKDFSVSQETARKWLEGLAMPRQEKIIEICARFGCREEWLNHGKEPMMEDANFERLKTLYYKATDGERRLVLEVGEKILADYK